MEPLVLKTLMSIPWIMKEDRLTKGKGKDLSIALMVETFGSAVHHPSKSEDPSMTMTAVGMKGVPVKMNLVVMSNQKTSVAAI